MTATAFANDPVLDLHDLDSDPHSIPLASEAAMDRWFGRSHLDTATSEISSATAPAGAVHARAVHDDAAPGGNVQLVVLEGEGQGAGASGAQFDPMVEVYRRRRFAIALALTAILLLVSQLAGISLTSFGPTSSTVDESTPVVHVVRPGDTYAGIAAELGADHPQSFASELEQANGFAELTVGQRLVVNLPGLSPAG